MMNTRAKDESEALVAALLPLAKRMLKEFKEFYPYGGYMRPSGEIVDVGASVIETEHPKPQDLIFILRESFREKAKTGECTAVAIIFDVRVVHPETHERTTAIEACIDHIDEYSVEVFYPYQLIDADIVFGPAFAQKGAYSIFKSSQ